MFDADRLPGVQEICRVVERVQIVISKPSSMKLFIVLSLLGTATAAAKVDTDWIRSTLQDHFSEPRHHATNPAYKLQAKDFILQEFKSYGLETHVDTFDTLLPSVKGNNIIGILKGKHFKTVKDRVAGLAAHYDTMRDTPGVDDNGAAVAVMLQAAKELVKHPRNNTIIFVAFDFEEWELNVPQIACGSISCGSEHFMENWVNQFWQAPPVVTGVIVMDTIMNINQNDDTQTIPQGFVKLFPNVVASINADGKEGDFIAAIGRPFDSKVLDAFVTSFSSLGQPEFEIEKFNITVLPGPIVTQQQFIAFQDLMRSDHYSFWSRGIPAIFVTDTANFRGYMNICYHHSCDKMSRVTDKMIQFAGKTTQALIGALDKLAPSVDTATTGAGTGCVSIIVLLASVLLHLLY